MTTWLEMSRSPEFNPAILSRVLQQVSYDLNEFKNSIGEVAFVDKIEKAMLGQTIIIGGYLNTQLIAAKSIFAKHLDVDSLSAISANLGTITSGSLNIGNGAFKVSSAGKLEATGADISGKITANSGSISNWTLGTNIYAKKGDTYTTLKSGGDVAFAAGSSSPNDTTGAALQIFHDGRLRANKDGVRRVELDYDSLKFFSSDGSLAGNIIAGSPPYVERFYFKGNDRDVEISTGNMYRAYIDLMHNEPYPGLQNTGAVAIRANNNKGNSASIIVYGSGQISLATTPGDVFGGENRVFINAYQVLTRQLVSCGSINISPTANSPSSIRVYFPVTFNKAPIMVASAWSGAPETSVKEVTVNNISRDYGDIVIYRTNSTATTLFWIAMEPK